MASPTMKNIQARLRQFFPGISVGEIFSPFRLIWLDPLNGNDGNDGLSLFSAKATLDGASGAFSVAIAGQNDTIVLVSDGATTSTARVNAAFDWNKKATHMIGMCSGSIYSQRARLAPASTTTAFANFFKVSVDGCYFENLEWFDGFTTGTTAQICMTITGGRNVFRNCHLAGMGDAESGASATSRSLKITAGENYFENCTIGVDTISRSAANAQLEITTAAARNYFRNCRFVSYATSATALMITVGANGIDRECTFENCIFRNNNTTLTHLGSFNATQTGGAKFLFINPVLMGITDFGSTAVVLVNGFTPGAGAGISVAPTA